MKCNTPIDPKTKCALSGDELETALKDPNSPRCGQELSADDVFCPACGEKVEQLVLPNSTVEAGHGSSAERRMKAVANRATRFDFWIASVCFFLTNLLGFFFASADSDPADRLIRNGLGLVNLCAYLYFIKTSVRRLHDIGRSGWLIAPSVGLTIISTVLTVVGAVCESGSVVFEVLHWAAILVNLGMVVWLGFAPGTKGTNKYGPDPCAGAGMPITRDSGIAKEGGMLGAAAENSDLPYGGQGLAVKDNVSAFNDTDAEQALKRKSRSNSSRVLIPVVVAACGIAFPVIRHVSWQSMKRANDMLSQRASDMVSQSRQSKELKQNLKEFEYNMKAAALELLFGGR